MSMQTLYPPDRCEDERYYTVNRNFPQEGLHKKSTVAAVYDRR